MNIINSGEYPTWSQAWKILFVCSRSRSPALWNKIILILLQKTLDIHLYELLPCDVASLVPVHLHEGPLHPVHLPLRAHRTSSTAATQ